MGTLHVKKRIYGLTARITLDMWEHCTNTSSDMWERCTKALFCKDFVEKKRGSVWITVDKIQGYVGALHGNLWVRCTATYGFVARNKYENASNINALNDNSERLTCF